MSVPASPLPCSCQTPLARPLEPASILVVDDDDMSRRLIDATLDALQLSNPRLHAVDGDDAVAQLSACARGELPVPALVLLDGQMPGRSGLHVLQWMREQPALQAVPVVMLTGVSDVESIRNAYDAGATSYLVKPVAFEALADVLRNLGTRWVLL